MNKFVYFGLKIYIILYWNSYILPGIIIAYSVQYSSNTAQDLVWNIIFRFQIVII